MISVNLTSHNIHWPIFHIESCTTAINSSTACDLSHLHLHPIFPSVFRICPYWFRLIDRPSKGPRSYKCSINASTFSSVGTPSLIAAVTTLTYLTANNRRPRSLLKVWYPAVCFQYMVAWKLSSKNPNKLLEFSSTYCIGVTKESISIKTAGDQ